MKWYQYCQNNSGGSHIGPAHLVFVEAGSADAADVIAEQHGLYWDYDDRYFDCPCCGERWSRAAEIAVPKYRVGTELWRDQSLYLVPFGRPGVLVRNACGQWVSGADELIARARAEIDAQEPFLDTLAEWPARFTIH